MRIPVCRVDLEGDLGVPRDARGAVLFANGSGSGRLSPRNAYVAEALRGAGFATLLFDLLTPAEAADRGKVFDIGLLAARLAGATEWARGRAALRGLARGYFGASTGAAAALLAAARDERIAAVVARGGRPDLADEALPVVRAPTLLIVGGDDDVVLELNRHACRRLRCTKRLALVPGATHLFEEPGALDQVVRLAIDWFELHLAADERRGEAGRVR